MPLFSSRASALVLLAAMVVGFDWGGRLGRLTEDLENPDAEVRASAVRELADHAAADVGPLVLAALDDVDALVRIDAADTAARLRLDSAVPHLLGWLESEDEDRRAAAARALGRLSHPDIGAALTRALGDPRASVRRAAIEGLRRSGFASAAAPIASALDDADGSVRAAAAQALGDLGGDTSVFALATHASDEATDVRAAIASSLGASSDARAGTTLRRLLGDPSADVRLAAALALGRLRLDEAVPELAALSRQVGTGEEREVAAAAIAALGRARGPESFAALADAGASPYGELESTARAALLERLRLDLTGTEAELVDALVRPEGTRPAWVAAMLASGVVRGLPAASAPLVGLATTGRIGADVALRALGHAGGDAALPFLLVSFEDAQRRGTSMTASLDGLDAYFDAEGPDGRAADPLIEALATSSDASTRARVVHLLGRTASPRSAPTLLGLLTTEHEPTMLRELLVALAGLEGITLDPSDQRAVAAALRSNDAEVRDAAARALGALGDGAALEALLVALDTEPHLDRVAAAMAIGLAAQRLAIDGELSARVASILGARLRDEDDALADAARDALAQWGSDAALDALLTGLDGASDRRAPYFSMTLGRFDAPRAHARLREELGRALADRAPARLAAAALMLGEHGDASDAHLLVERWTELPWPASAAASFSLARLARRGVLEASDVPLLCALAALHDPIVRANVAVALTALEGRCESVSPETWIERPHAAIVRAAAARWLSVVEPRIAGRALATCLDSLPPPGVEAACRAPLLPALDATIDVTARELDGRTPAAHADVVLLLPDGTAMFARTDARARLHLSNGPTGPLSLEEPSSLPLEP